MNYPIIKVDVYQAVIFNSQGQKFFITTDHPAIKESPGAFAGVQVVKITELDNGYVLIESEKEMVKIGPANVAFIVYDKKNAKVATLKKETK